MLVLHLTGLCQKFDFFWTTTLLVVQQKIKKSIFNYNKTTYMYVVSGWFCSYKINLNILFYLDDLHESLPLD